MRLEREGENSKFPYAYLLLVRLERFCIRRGSGAERAHPGGKGVVRALSFLEPIRANILANRREVPPRGIEGGGNASPGPNWVERADGRIDRFGVIAAVELDSGDRFVTETRGGGGYGRRGE